MSTITSLDPKRSYEIYKESLTIKIEHITQSLIITREKINYMANQIYFIGESHGLRNDLYIKIKDFINDGTRPTIEYLQEVNYKNFQSEDWFIAKTQIITNYFKSIVSLFLEEYNLEEYIRVLKLSDLDYKTYYRILISYYFNVANKLLRGEKYVIDNVGLLQVVTRPGIVSKHMKFKPDWGESIRLLKLFAENHHPDIYNDFINKTISKAAFIEKLKPYCYNEETNPTGFKWLIHRHTPTNAWICFYEKKIDTRYNIVPSNFVMNATRSQIDFTNNIQSISEIFETHELGFRDKLNALVRFDSNYINNFEKR